MQLARGLSPPWTRSARTRKGQVMVNTRSESRVKTGLIGIRVEPDLDVWLATEAAAQGVTKAALARDILDATRHRKSRRTTSRVFEVIAEDRALIEAFNRHAGRLTGALVTTAKAARVGGLTSYHLAVEHLLAETKTLRKSIDLIVERMSR